MNKNISYKKNWHIIILVSAILILSVFSWVHFVNTMRNKILHHVAEEKKVEVISAEKTTQKVRLNEENTESHGFINMISKGLDSADSLINKLDSKWLVFKNSYWSRIDAVATYYILGEISSAQVLDGLDKWLFYKSRSDGDPIGDYEGTNLYTKTEMEEIAQSALITQNEIESKGIKFAILVAPNKENVYSEYMPDVYSHADKTRTDLMVEYLLNQGINIVSPKNDLIDIHESSQLYYYYDTHWNQLGAYIGVRTTLMSWGISMPALQDRNILSSDLNEKYHYYRGGDLARIVGLQSIFSDEIEYEIDGTGLMDWETFETEQATGLSYYYNEKAPNSSRLLLVGDSFRSSMVPSLREQFTDVYVIHRKYYTPDVLDDIQPEYIIDEYVERYSDDIDNIEYLLQ